MATNTRTNPLFKRIRFDLSYSTHLLLEAEDADKLLDILQRNPIYDSTGKGTATELYKASPKGVDMGMVSEERIEKTLVDHARTALEKEDTP